MRKTVLLIIVLFPLLSLAQERDTFQVEIGGIKALASPTRISTNMIFFDEKVERLINDTAMLDSGSVCILVRPRDVTEDIQVIGRMYFEHVREILYKSYITARNLNPDSEYEIHLILSINGNVRERIFMIRTIK